jgi:hypothetical protein
MAVLPLLSLPVYAAATMMHHLYGSFIVVSTMFHVPIEYRVRVPHCIALKIIC